MPTHQPQNLRPAIDYTIGGPELLEEPCDEYLQPYYSGPPPPSQIFVPSYIQPQQIHIPHYEIVALPAAPPPQSVYNVSRTPDQLNPWNPYNRFVRNQIYPQYPPVCPEVTDRNWTDAMIRNNSPGTRYRNFANSSLRFVPVPGSTRDTPPNFYQQQQPLQHQPPPPHHANSANNRPIKTEASTDLLREVQIIDISSSEEETEVEEGEVLDEEIVRESRAQPEGALMANVLRRHRSEDDLRVRGTDMAAVHRRDRLLVPFDYEENDSGDSFPYMAVPTYPTHDRLEANTFSSLPHDAGTSVTNGARIDSRDSYEREFGRHWDSSGDLFLGNANANRDEPMNLTNRLKRSCQTVGFSSA